MTGQTNPTKSRREGGERRGFTLIELLVVIAIVSVLVGVLLPVLAASRESAELSRKLSGARQLAMGHAAYQVDYAGHVMWGYPPVKPRIDGRALSFHASGFGFSSPDLTALRYPWRLFPYVSEVWEILHCHEAQVPSDPYSLGLEPSFGLNTMYVGGHGLTGGVLFNGFRSDPADSGNAVPNRGQHVVFRDYEVRRASRLLLFAEAQQWQGSGLYSDGDGLHYLTPPRGNGHRWVARGDGIEAVSGFEWDIKGAPLGRHGEGAATSFFDGHGEVLTPKALEDMRLWANRAETPDYDF